MGRTIFGIITCIILLVCCIVFEADIAVSLARLGLSCMATSFVSRKDGGMDGRYKFLIIWFLLGLTLLVLGIVLI